jgi:hypothetical protein
MTVIYEKKITYNYFKKWSLIKIEEFLFYKCKIIIKYFILIFNTSIILTHFLDNFAIYYRNYIHIFIKIKFTLKKV